MQNIKLSHNNLSREEKDTYVRVLKNKTYAVDKKRRDTHSEHCGVESESELDPNSLTKVGARVLKN